MEASVPGLISLGAATTRLLFLAALLWNLQEIWRQCAKIFIVNMCLLFWAKSMLFGDYAIQLKNCTAINNFALQIEQ